MTHLAPSINQFRVPLQEILKTHKRRRIFYSPLHTIQRAGKKLDRHARVAAVQRIEPAC